ncbi:hypothetical protein [Sphingobium sp. CR28]|uniref:hypothetical protein n=1 Tax=Sphingobium sp. CR28 TaxID=3400272 RepID=UPI003FEEAECC
MRSFIAAAVMTLPAPVIAQTGTMFDNKPTNVPDDKALSDADRRKIMVGFANCTIKRWRTGVERYLATAPGSKDAAKLADRLSVNECLISGRMQFNEPLYRAAAYDALYNIIFAKSAPVDFSNVPPIDYATESGASVYGDVAAATSLRKLADCAVRYDPSKARALILSSVGSSSESSAFVAIASSTSKCMTNDMTLKFSKLTLRGVVAEALYRLSVNAGSLANEVKGG